MPFEVIHPKDFPARLGLLKVPTKREIHRWREKFGFPQSLVVPRGYYRLADVQAWFANAPVRGAKA